MREADFALYPNPFGDNITYKSEIRGHLTIYDVTGRLVCVQPVQPGEHAVMFTGHLASGPYFWMVRHNPFYKGAAKHIKKKNAPTLDEITGRIVKLK
jgi:hypothetical protein